MPKSITVIKNTNQIYNVAALIGGVPEGYTIVSVIPVINGVGSALNGYTHIVDENSVHNAIAVVVSNRSTDIDRTWLFYIRVLLMKC